MIGVEQWAEIRRLFFVEKRATGVELRDVERLVLDLVRHAGLLRS